MSLAEVVFKMIKYLKRKVQPIAHFSLGVSNAQQHKISSGVFPCKSGSFPSFFTEVTAKSTTVFSKEVYLRILKDML